MGPKTALLVQSLTQAIAHLNSRNETHWRDWLQYSHDLIVRSDYAGIEKLLRAYGGMGSFNDFASGDDTLGALSTQLYTLADEIRCDHETN